MAEKVTVGAGDALIIVDVQNDFCPGGALAVGEGDRVVPVLNALARRFETVVATRDWHPAEHCSFTAQGGPWPAHCVPGTPGAEYHPELDTAAIDLHVLKADTPDDDVYSGFDGTPNLAEALSEQGIERVFVGGLATDYCVLQTVLSAREHGFETYAVVDAMRAVDVEPGDGERALERMRAAGAKLIEADAVTAGAETG